MSRTRLSEKQISEGNPLVDETELATALNDHLNSSTAHAQYLSVDEAGKPYVMEQKDFTFEKEKIYKLLWLIPQRFAYRWLMYVVLFRSYRRAIKGELQSWGVLKRTGNVKDFSSEQVIA